MADGLHVRSATAADSQEILDLVKTSLGDGNSRNPDYWNWKHAENPFGPSPCLVAEVGGQIVGLRTFMRWRWQADGREVPSVRAVDTATSPEWRGRGIFSRLTLALVEQMRNEGVAFVFNTPNELSQPGYLKMGWSPVGRATVWVRPLRPANLLRAVLGQSPTGGQEDRSSGHFAPAGELFRDPNFAVLVASLGETGERLWTPRTERYLRWRYEQIPEPSYFAAWNFDGARPAAIIFRFKQHRKLKELRVCEILCPADEAGVASARRVLKGGVSAADADFAAGMGAANTPERKVLLGSGFVPALRSGPVLTARPLADTLRGLDLFSMASWRTSIGDLELF